MYKENNDTKNKIQLVIDNFSSQWRAFKNFRNGFIATVKFDSGLKS